MYCRRKNIRGNETVQCVFDDDEDLEEWISLLKSVIEKIEDLPEERKMEKEDIANMVDLLEKKTFRYTSGSEKGKIVMTWFPNSIITLVSAFFSLLIIQSVWTTKCLNDYAKCLDDYTKILKKYKELFSFLKKLNALPDKAIVSLK